MRQPSQGTGVVQKFINTAYDKMRELHDHLTELLSLNTAKEDLLILPTTCEGFKDDAEAAALAASGSATAAAASAAAIAPTEFVLSGSTLNVLTLPSAADALAWDVILEGVYCNTYSANGMRIVVKIGTHDNYVFGYVSGNGVVVDQTSQPGLTFGWSRNVVLPARSEGNISMRIARNGSAAEFVGGSQIFNTGDVVTSDTGLGRGYVAASGGVFNDTITLYAECGDPYAAAAITGKVYITPVLRA